MGGGGAPRSATAFGIGGGGAPRSFTWPDGIGGGGAPRSATVSGIGGGGAPRSFRRCAGIGGGGAPKSATAFGIGGGGAPRSFTAPRCEPLPVGALGIAIAVNASAITHAKLLSFMTFLFQTEFAPVGRAKNRRFHTRREIAYSAARGAKQRHKLSRGAIFAPGHTTRGARRNWLGTKIHDRERNQ